VASQLLNLKSVRSSRVATATLVMVLLLRPADAQVELCQKDATDDTLRSIPQSLVPAAKQLFGLVKVPDQQIRRSTVFRCAEGRVLLCNYGANLPCGKAKADRHPRGVVAWCRENPHADFVPNYARPWGSIYDWRCVAGAAEIVGQVEEIDPRGFVARCWKPLD
jgi:hypothetical protein